MKSSKKSEQCDLDNDHTVHIPQQQQRLSQENNDDTTELHAHDTRKNVQADYTDIDESQSNELLKSIARLCGTSRQRCGYCCGKRAHVLKVEDAYNKQIISDDDTKPIVDYSNKDTDSTSSNSETERVDETCSSKSYGLEFDQISYNTYEKLINRGWRRSGSHLYRPHNFESRTLFFSTAESVLQQGYIDWGCYLSRLEMTSFLLLCSIKGFQYP